MTGLTVLVTNDDGVASHGIAALVRAVAGPGRRVVVAAPASDQSGTSAAVAPRPAAGVPVERVTIPGLREPGFEDLVAFAVDGPPALAVLAARLGELGEVARSAAVVASGINLGPNTGTSVLFSGTVGAALAAANVGQSALAVSINSMVPRHLDTATLVAAAALEWLLEAPSGTVLNVNVPDLAVDRLAGVRQAPLAPLGTVQVAAREPGPGPFAVQLRVSESQPPADSDTGLLRAGWVTVTPLLGIRADAEAEAAAFIEHAVSRAA
ncbi:MAG TPA: 5'/3'-nucleotidase SurE [Acidimicrobiales bacterium]|jgi:5'-nucleotidase|nr:5'/3'-nucleotidase SurE [Acidimicrobiales bacterium]